MGTDRDDIITSRAIDKPKRKIWPLVLLVLALLILAAIIAAVLALRSSSTDEAKLDVTVGACSADPAGGKPKAVGNIKNHSSKTSNYQITVKFNDESGNQVSEGVDAVKGVKKGETANFSLEGDRSAKGALKCEVKSVSRTHLPGQ